MEAILNSFLLVAATEMGDKTQLLALVLASKYKKPWHVMAGILVATILNHALAGLGWWLDFIENSTQFLSFGDLQPHFSFLPFGF